MKLFSKILLLLLVLQLFQCSMNSEDIRKGKYLEQAKETNASDFFEKRMKNRIKKVLGANWEILFESSEFVYFGYPLISFFKEGTYLDEFFKVNKSNLESEFPSYKVFDGIYMKRVCLEFTINNKVNLVDKYLFKECKASLEKDFLKINAEFTVSTNNEPKKIIIYTIQLDKKSLNQINTIKRED